MRLDAFIVADSVREGAHNKFEIVGAFITTVKSADDPPIVIATLSFVARFMLESGDEEKKYEVVLTIDSPAGQVLSTAPGVLPREILVTQPDAGREAAVIIATEIQGLSFPDYGEYRAQLLLNGEPVGERFISVVNIGDAEESAKPNTGVEQG